MKKMFYTSFVLLGLAFAQPVTAQVSVNVNLGLQPSWGPVGYDYARYYYMPELNIYYDVSNRSYTYYDGNRWISHRTLPKRYRKHNLHRTYKVVVNDARPWQNHQRYHKKYRGYAKNYKQMNRRDGRSNQKFQKAHYKQHRKIEKARGKHSKKINRGRARDRR